MPYNDLALAKAKEKRIEDRAHGLLITHSGIQAVRAVAKEGLTICKTTWEWNPEYSNVLNKTYPSYQ